MRPRTAGAQPPDITALDAAPDGAIIGGMSPGLGSLARAPRARRTMRSKSDKTGIWASDLGEGAFPALLLCVPILCTKKSPGPIVDFFWYN